MDGRPREVDAEEDDAAVSELMICWLRSKSMLERPADERNAREEGEEGAWGVEVVRAAVRAAEARVGRLYRFIDEDEEEEEEEGGCEGKGPG